MGMTPEDYFGAFVEGNLDDCEDDPMSVRRVFNAAVSASHMADCCFKYGHRHEPTAWSDFPKIGQYLEYLSAQTGGAFQDIRSIANAYKHLYTAGKFEAYSSVSSTGSVELLEFSEPCEGIGALCETDMDIQTPDRGTPEVVVKRKDGSKQAVLPLLRDVVRYWRRELG